MTLVKLARRAMGNKRAGLHRLAAATVVFGVISPGPLLRAQEQKDMRPFSMEHRRAALAHSPVDVSFLLDARPGSMGLSR
jgi:hypothetical protein